MREWLKEIRGLRGLSQQEVADKSGIAQSYYGMIESGQRGNPLNVDIAKSIAAALDFDWTRFYEDIPARKTS